MCVGVTLVVVEVVTMTIDQCRTLSCGGGRYHQPNTRLLDPMIVVVTLKFVVQVKAKQIDSVRG